MKTVEIEEWKILFGLLFVAFAVMSIMFAFEIDKLRDRVKMLEGKAQHLQNQLSTPKSVI